MLSLEEGARNAFKTSNWGLGFRVGPFKGIYRDYIGVILGLYGDNGKENGNYYVGFRVSGLGFRV